MRSASVGSEAPINEVVTLRTTRFTSAEVNKLSDLEMLIYRVTIYSVRRATANHNTSRSARQGLLQLGSLVLRIQSIFGLRTLHTHCPIQSSKMQLFSFFYHSCSVIVIFIRCKSFTLLHFTTNQGAKEFEVKLQPLREKISLY